MGYYLQVPQNKEKAQQLIDLYGAHILDRKPMFKEIEPDKAIICVVDNGPFEAAGYAFNERELEAFALPDGRPRKWLILDKPIVHRLTGYNEA